MKSKMNIKSIVIMATVGIISLFFINMSLAVSTAKVSVETANLRETADENAKILELLSKEEKVDIIQKVGNWYQVKAKGITGFLREDLITVKEEAVENNSNPENITKEELKHENQTENKEVEEKEEINSEEIELGKQKVTENIKLKIVPVINATDIIEVKKDEEVNVIEIMNGWACIETRNTKGWIRKEKLKKEEPKVEQRNEIQQPTEQTKTVIKTLYVNSTSINLRKEANTSSGILANLAVNTAVEVLSENNGWSQVRVNGKEGYVSSSLLSNKKQETSRSSSIPRTSSTESVVQQKGETGTTSVSKNGDSIVAYAKQFIGTKYKYGGTSPSTGFDCSGFTTYVYKHFGVSLPRTSGGQSGVGTAVSKANLAPGDLVIYSGHVAIYVGGGQVIHAPRPGKTVCIVPVNQAASNYLGARRVL